MLIKKGSLFLFRLFGISVYVNWSWAVVAVLQIYWAMGNPGFFSRDPHGFGFQLAIYLSLFLIVLMHEFGHSLACKSVGGTSDTIILWPLGGVALVAPPPRPGAWLWSIVAGPLVNVALIPVTAIPAFFLTSHAGAASNALTDFVVEMAIINVVLLVVNMLPVYPLDGGKILWSLLWFAFGRGMGLLISGIVGCVGAVGMIALAVWLKDSWLAVIMAWVAMGAWRAVQAGQAIIKLHQIPRRRGPRCPNCQEEPPVGRLWKCRCGAEFDTFECGSKCPACGLSFTQTMCPLCGMAAAKDRWFATTGFPVQTPGS